MSEKKWKGERGLNDACLSTCDLDFTIRHHSLQLGFTVKASQTEFRMFLWLNRHVTQVGEDNSMKLILKLDQCRVEELLRLATYVE